MTYPLNQTPAALPASFEAHPGSVDTFFPGAEEADMKWITRAWTHGPWIDRTCTKRYHRGSLEDGV